MSTQDQFLPEDYKEPITSKYMKFEEGENKFRVLPAKKDKQTLIMGFEYWKTDKEGKRYPCRVKDPAVQVGELEVNPKTGEIDAPKFFWALAVWDYKDKSVKILEVKQKTVRQALESLSNNPKWGSPIGYDITVTQTVEGGKTTYPSTTPDPKEEISKEIMDIYNATSLNLDALYGKPGSDPFQTNEQLVEEVLSK